MATAKRAKGMTTDQGLPRIVGLLSVHWDSKRQKFIARGWPKKPGPPTQAQIDARKEFALVSTLVKNKNPVEYQAAITMTVGTAITWKDAMSMAAYGTLIEATGRDGTQYRSYRQMANEVQPLLDSITNTVGAILVRTPDGWRGLRPGTDQQVLIFDAGQGLPDWADPVLLPPIADGEIWIGNGTGVAVARTLHGDASVDDTGAIALGNVVAPVAALGNGSHVPVLQIDAKGRVVDYTTDAVVGSDAISSIGVGQLWIGNTTDHALARTLSGDVTCDHVGNVQLAATGIAAGNVGTGTAVPVLTLDVKGRVVGYSTVNVMSAGNASADFSPFSDGIPDIPNHTQFTVTDDTTANHGTGSMVDLAHRGVALVNTHGSGGSTVSWFSVSAISSSFTQLDAYLQPNFFDRNSAWGFYIGARDNAASGGKLHAFGVRNSGTVTAYSEAKYTDLNTPSAVSTETGGGFVCSRPLWLRLTNSGGNFTFYVSFDGERYFQVKQVSATVFLSATLTGLGIFLINNLVTNGAVMCVNLMDWKAA